MDQKQIDKQVNREIKKLNRQAEKNLSKGGNMTVLGNSEFEVLFGATNRNNEVQFRLLFTPLAQKQLLEIMKEKQIGFGDDFGFVKSRMINYLYPQHLRSFKLNISPTYFQGYDFDAVKERFHNYNQEYFRHLYFAFAPILAIPLYQQQKPHEYIYKDLYDSYASFYEHEAVVNGFGAKTLAHPQSATPNILKTAVLKTEGQSDTLAVTAYGYRTVERVDYINKLGGDGRMHTIPVHWTEYIPVSQKNEVALDLVEEAEELTYGDEFRQAIERVRTQKQLDAKDVYQVGLFLAYILKS